MLDSLEQRKKEIELLDKSAADLLKQCQDAAALENFHQSRLGKKGALSTLRKSLKELPLEERRAVGQWANEKQKKWEEMYKAAMEKARAKELEERLQKESYDALRPLYFTRGHLHPITQMQNRVEDIFSSMGFQIMDGPEVESDLYNFERLNFSSDHPARDMQDTIWTEEGNLLRTHTSPVQLRSMEKLSPPFRIIAPGRCFRYEETDASHENTFHQVEGMLVDREVSIAHLIYIMKSFLSSIFFQNVKVDMKGDVKVRLRPGYFPFVEPGFELDMSCLLCGGGGCQTCKKSGWLEILPCGLVHPKVLEAGGIDSKEWSGFAFGLGLDRLVMMSYGIEDIRHFLSGNLRFLEQF